MKLDEITLGSKAHHELVAAAKADEKMTWRKFIQQIKDSTMSDDEMDAVLDEIVNAYGHPRALDKEVTRYNVEQLAAITDADLGELLTLAGF